MIRIGLIGAGAMGSMHASVYARLANTQIVAIADTNAQKAADLAAKTGSAVHLAAETLIHEDMVDVVDICLPSYQHKEYAVIALQAGKHVFCEKPMALNYTDALAMLAAKETSGKYLLIGQVLRFWDEYCILKRMVASQKFGPLLTLSCYRFAEFPQWSVDNWILNSRLSGGVPFDLHIHDTDFIHDLLGKPDRVMSFAVRSDQMISHISTVYYYPNILVQADAGMVTGKGFPLVMGFRAVFRDAVVIFDNRLSPGMMVYDKTAAPSQPDEIQNRKDTPFQIANLTMNDGYFAEIAYFIDCIRNKLQPVRALPEDIAFSVRIVEAEIESALSDRPVSVRPI